MVERLTSFWLDMTVKVMKNTEVKKMEEQLAGTLGDGGEGRDGREGREEETEGMGAARESPLHNF